MAALFALPLAPADSARVVGDVYGVSLLALVPVALGALGALALRHAGAQSRVLAWRAAIVALLATWAGPWLPVHWVAWVLPEALAAPLVSLGRAQLAGPGAPEPVGDGRTWLIALACLYLAGAVAVALHLFLARWRLLRLLRAATPLTSIEWRARLERAARAAGLERPVRLVMSPRVRVPMTWGVRRPVLALPADASQWEPSHLHAALVHELSHVAAGDAAWAIVARVTCALAWFHPASWWLAARHAAEVELACDERVLLGGVRRSDYAELLASVHGRLVPAGSLALVRRGRLRPRLAAILDPARVLRAPARAARAVAMGLTLVLAIPMATIRVAPTRAVLTRLMRDARWESRAWAVVRLAQRPDSLEVARAAARRDPDPQVRAWARYALARERAPLRPAVAPQRDHSL